MSRRSLQTGELAFVSARFRSRLVLWLTAAADQGGSKRDHEKRSQTILLEDECPPSFALRMDLPRQGSISRAKMLKAQCAISHMVNVSVVDLDL